MSSSPTFRNIEEILAFIGANSSPLERHEEERARDRNRTPSERLIHLLLHEPNVDDSDTTLARVQDLLDEGADANCVGQEDGQTPLVVVSYKGFVRIAKQLLPKADVNQANFNGVTPLIMASQEGRVEIVELLLQANANVNQVQVGGARPGATALTLASQKGHVNVVQLLLKAKAEVNHCETNRVTALSLACRYGNENIADLLLQAKADVNQAQDNGITPLMSACESAHIKIVDLLLRYNADVNQADCDGYSALSVACECGHIEVVRKLLKARADVNQKNMEGNTSLIIASCQGHAQVVKLLLKASAAVNEANKHGVTSLIWTCQKKHVEVANLLLRAKADINQAQDNGSNPLLMACSHGHPEMVKLLLKAKAKVNQVQDSDGDGPLIMACRNGYMDVVKLLLQANADVNQANNDGDTPLSMACQENHVDIAELLLRQHNPDVNKSRNDGITCLMLACQYGNVGVVDLLLQAKANVNQVAKTSGSTALLFACQSGHKDVIQLLIQADADINFGSSNGTTPLMMASQKGHLEVVKLLIRAKARINQARKDGASSLLMACGEGHADIVKLLLEANAKVNQATEEGLTSLMQACAKGKVRVVNMLIQEAQADVNLADKNGATPLIYACSNGHVDVAKLLLAADADVNKATNEGQTCLMQACAMGYGRVVYMLLQETQANVNQADHKGITSLMMTCFKGNVNIAQLLLHYNAYVNMADNSGHTALIKNCLSPLGTTQVAQMLLQWGANVDQADKEGLTPLYYALAQNRRDLARLLVSGGANINYASDDQGQTLLLAACRKGSREAVGRLLTFGAKAEIPNRSDETPLYVASQRGDYEIIAELFKCGGGVSLLEPWVEKFKLEQTGENFLHLAVRTQNYHVVQTLLLNHPFLAEETDKLGQYPLHTTMMQKPHSELVRVVLESNREAVNMKSDSGKTPLQLGLENKADLSAIAEIQREWKKAFEEVITESGDSMLQVALDNEADPKVIDFALSKYGEATRIRNNRGESALYTAIKAARRAPNNSDLRRVVKRIFSMNQTATSETTADGRSACIDLLIPAVREENRNVMAVELLKTFVHGGGLKDAHRIEELFRLDDPLQLRSFFRIFDTRGYAGDADEQTAGLQNEEAEQDSNNEAPPMLDLNEQVIGRLTLMEVLVDLVDRNVDPSEAASAILNFIRDAIEVDSPHIMSILPLRGERIQIQISEKPVEETMARAADVAKNSRLESLRKWGESYGRFLGRYRINRNLGYYRSATSVVVFATEHTRREMIETGERCVQTSGTEEVVALKFMADDAYFAREIRTRESMVGTLGKTDAESDMKRFVIKIRDSYTGKTMEQMTDMDGSVLLEENEPIYRTDFFSEVTKYQSLIFLAEGDTRIPPCHVIVMDCGLDGDLHQIINREPLSCEEAIEIACGIANCLRFMNRDCKMVHGDVKARNFVVIDKRVAAIDFDNAASIERQDSVGRKRTSTGYLPPEQARLELLKRSSMTREDLLQRIALTKSKLAEAETAWRLAPSGTEQSEEAGYKYSIILGKMKEAKDALERFDRPHETLPAYPQYDMWCFGVMLYAICTRSTLFHHDIREDVDDDELEKISRWSKKDLEEKLKHVPKDWKEFSKVLRKLLQPEVRDRPISWEEILLDLDPTSTVASTLRSLDVIPDRIDRAVVDITRTINERLDCVEQIMMEQQNISCPYVFKIITADEFTLFMQSIKLVEKQESEEQDDYVIESLDRAKKHLRSVKDLLTSKYIIETARLKSRFSHLIGKKEQVVYLQLLCGRTFKPVVSYKVGTVTYSERIVKISKVAAKLCTYAAKVGTIVNLGVAAAWTIGCPLPMVPASSIERATEFLDQLDRDDPLKDMEDRMITGFTIDELRDFEGFIEELERAGKMRQMFDISNKKKLKKKSWKDAMVQEHTPDKKHVTFISAQETRRFQQNSQGKPKNTRQKNAPNSRRRVQAECAP